MSASDIDAFAQRHAWASLELHRGVVDTLDALQTAGDQGLRTLKHRLQAVVDTRDPGLYLEGSALRCLWSLPDLGEFRELEKRLRIVVVRRAQSRLYDCVSQLYFDPDWDQCRTWFLECCWQQLGQRVEQKANMLFLAYHKEFGSTVQACALKRLGGNLFPSAAEKKATMWAQAQQQQSYGYGMPLPRPAKPRSKKKRKGESPQSPSPADSSSGDDLAHNPPANPQEDATASGSDGVSPDVWTRDEDETCEEPAERESAEEEPSEDHAECESVHSVDKYGWCELRTKNSFSDGGDWGYQDAWWSRDQQWEGDEQAGSQGDSEADGGIAPYNMAACILELTGVLAWVDEKATYTTHSFCDVSSLQETWGRSSFRLHYRLKSLLSMLVAHPKCVLGVTCVNSRYKDIAATALTQVLKDCSGGNWTWHDDESPRYLRNEETGRSIFVWTSEDKIQQYREKEENHHFSKNCQTIWDDLARGAGVNCKFGRHNTVCIDTKKQNFDAIGNVVVAPEWSSDTWVKGFGGLQGIPEEPLVPPLHDQGEADLEQFLNELLDSINENCDKDLRVDIETYHA